ncbi:hypothetical protein [Ostreiculturibacter nitratireducens]|uniref:hypothetical protein n=1 Tax=Ostreiculturibacter nitratireducens TaxID=3075226 RepID=UPI0031B5CD75
MIKRIKLFRRSEDGAVTADWVLLTAAIVGLSFPLVAMIKGGQDILAGKIHTSLSTREIE